MDDFCYAYFCCYFRVLDFDLDFCFLDEAGITVGGFIFELKTGISISYDFINSARLLLVDLSLAANLLIDLCLM